MSCVDYEQFSCWLAGCWLETNPDERTLAERSLGALGGVEKCCQGCPRERGGQAGMESRRSVSAHQQNEGWDGGMWLLFRFRLWLNARKAKNCLNWCLITLLNDDTG